MTKIQAKKALEQLMLRIGPGFHPDNKAKDYVNNQTNRPTFQIPGEAAAFDATLDAVWEVLGEKIYSHGIKLHDKLFKIKTTYTVHILNHAITITCTKKIRKNEAIAWLTGYISAHLCWSNDFNEALADAVGHTPEGLQIV